MKDNISPEEKLLRLIRGDKKPKPVGKALDDTGIDKKTIPSIANLKSPINKSTYSLARAYLTGGAIQKIMVALMAASVIYAAVSFIRPSAGLDKVSLPEAGLKKIDGLDFAPKEELKPYEFYLEPTKQRQIFGNAPVPEAAIPKVATDGTDFIKQINLVGIISGDNPQAVIEDKNTQKTYYVSKGQFIGEIQIEDIQEGKIILNHKGQRFELYL